MEGSESIVQPDINVNFYINNDETRVRVTIEGEEIDIYATAKFKSENNKIIYYDANCSSSRFNVIELSLESNLEDSMFYFEKYVIENNFTQKNMLKIYLRDIQSDTRDYYFIECFVEEDILNKVSLSNLPINRSNWIVKEFEGEIEEKNYSTPFSFSNDYEEFGLVGWYALTPHWRVKHFMTIGISTNLRDVQLGGYNDQTFRVEIVEQGIICEDEPNLNSSTTSCFSVQGVNLKLASTSKTAWHSSMIDGNVSKDLFAGALSASLGVNLGPLSASVSFSELFSSFGEIDINEGYKSYLNSGNNYTKGIEIRMNEAFSLNNNGAYFSVTAKLGDYGNSLQLNEDFLAEWIIVYREDAVGPNDISKTYQSTINIEGEIAILG